MSINRRSSMIEWLRWRLRSSYGLTSTSNGTNARYGRRHQKRTLETGQVLLIAVILLAVTLTIVLSITFSSRTDTQLTKLEEENQKALAAAEAGIEAALKAQTGQVVIGDTGTVPEGGTRILAGDDFKGEAAVTETYSKTSFTTPLIQKDEQYTFYMGAYDKDANTIGASTAQDLTICFGDGNQSTKSAVEITLVKGSGPTLKRYVVDSQDRIDNSQAGTNGCSSDSAFQTSYVLSGASDVGVDTKMVLVRVLYNSTKVHFSRSAALPSQGKYISSEATSGTGVSKKVELFQSYPQIPSDFFVTSF